MPATPGNELNCCSDTESSPALPRALVKDPLQATQRLPASIKGKGRLHGGPERSSNAATTRRPDDRTASHRSAISSPRMHAAAAAASDRTTHMHSPRRAAHAAADADVSLALKELMSPGSRHGSLYHLSLLKTSTHDWAQDKSLFYSPVGCNVGPRGGDQWSSSLRRSGVLLVKSPAKSHTLPTNLPTPSLTGTGLLFGVAAAADYTGLQQVSAQTSANVSSASLHSAHSSVARGRGTAHAPTTSASGSVGDGAAAASSAIASPGKVSVRARASQLGVSPSVVRRLMQVPMDGDEAQDDGEEDGEEEGGEEEGKEEQEEGLGAQQQMPVQCSVVGLPPELSPEPSAASQHGAESRRSEAGIMSSASATPAGLGASTPQRLRATPSGSISGQGAESSPIPSPNKAGVLEAAAGVPSQGAPPSPNQRSKADGDPEARHTPRRGGIPLAPMPPGEPSCATDNVLDVPTPRRRALRLEDSEQGGLLTPRRSQTQADLTAGPPDHDGPPCRSNSGSMLSPRVEALRRAGGSGVGGGGGDGGDGGDGGSGCPVKAVVHRLSVPDLRLPLPSPGPPSARQRLTDRLPSISLKGLDSRRHAMVMELTGGRSALASPNPGALPTARFLTMMQSFHELDPSTDRLLTALQGLQREQEEGGSGSVGGGGSTPRSGGSESAAQSGGIRARLAARAHQEVPPLLLLESSLAGNEKMKSHLNDAREFGTHLHQCQKVLVPVSHARQLRAGRTLV